MQHQMGLTKKAPVTLNIHVFEKNLREASRSNVPQVAQDAVKLITGTINRVAPIAGGLRSVTRMKGCAIEKGVIVQQSTLRYAVSDVPAGPKEKR
jgi:hypothetical protein